MSTPKAMAFDAWIRSRFRDLNTELEELYFAQEQRAAVEDVGGELKQQLVDEGRAFVVQLLEEGNTDEGFESAFDLLGNVGLYMGACRRHEITNPDRERTSPLKEASALAMQLGASLGVAPRFASAHLETHNLAINGSYKKFTSLEDEEPPSPRSMSSRSISIPPKGSDPEDSSSWADAGRARRSRSEITGPPGVRALLK